MKVPPGTVLILGADGFVGRHLAFGLRRAGWRVIASARRAGRLRAMGFDTLQADLVDPATNSADYWRSHLSGVTHVVNAVGVLNAPEHVYRAVHVAAPQALYSALPDGVQGLLISAVGIDSTDTPFARFRRDGEEVASRHNLTVLRVGLVLGDTSYGGSSLIRAFAAFPLFTPVVGRGDQRFNPIHATDLALAVDQALRNPPGPGPHDIGGSEEISQSGMIQGLRAWLGLRPAPVLRLPIGVARLVGRVGDTLRWGPISRNAVDQLEFNLVAKTSPAIASMPVSLRGYSEFVATRPAGTQDLWHARLYLMRPALRLVLALLWLCSGLLGLFLPASEFLPLLESTDMNDGMIIALARFSGFADLAVAAALLRGWRPRIMAGVQAFMVLVYTLTFGWFAPALWFLPLGGLLKNIPVLALIAIQAVLEDER